MAETRDYKKQGVEQKVTDRARQNAAGHDHHSCGGCSACHQMTRIQPAGSMSAWSGEGEQGLILQKPCASAFFQRNLGNSFFQSLSENRPAQGTSMPLIQRKCSCGGSCGGSEGMEEEEVKA